jgi:hypothetical protein
MVKILLLVGTALLLMTSGCAKRTPSCNDPQTKGLVAEAIVKYFVDTGFPASRRNEIVPAVEDVRVSKINKDIDKYECAATAKLVISGKDFEFPITYTSQRVEGEDRFYVEVQGIETGMLKILMNLERSVN